MRSIEFLKTIRTVYSRMTEPLTPEQWLELPAGRSNNILWNVGHVVVSQQMMHYALSGLPMHVDPALVAAFRKGSSPAEWNEPPEVEQIRGLLTELPRQLEQDHASGLFREYSPYKTALGVTLTSIEEALEFNNFHEGVHLGITMAIAKTVVGG